MAVQIKSGTIKTTENGEVVRLLSYNRIFIPADTLAPPVAGNPAYPEAGAEYRIGTTQQLSPARKIARSYLEQIVGKELTIEPDGDWFPYIFNASNRPSAGRPYFRFKEEKIVGNIIAIAYEQVLDNVIITGAGLFVRINQERKGVSGFHNGAHYPDAVHWAQKLIEKNGEPAISMEHLQTALGKVSEDSIIDITHTDVQFFRYRSETRLKEEDLVYRLYEKPEPDKEATFVDKQLFNPPDLPDHFNTGQHYEAVEVLFTTKMEERDTTHWRAFVEPDSNRLLFLEQFKAHNAQAAVFTQGPSSVTRSSMRNLRRSPSLDKERVIVPLQGLKQVAGNGIQPLEGSFVRLENIRPPDAQPPELGPPYDFVFPFDSYEFTACNTYYHCDNVFRLIEQVMEMDVSEYFRNTDFPVSVDPVTLGPQASVSGMSGGKGVGNFAFGMVDRSGADKGIGLATDLRVVLHEFGHAALFAHIQGASFSFTHGIGDSFAAILDDPLNDALDRFETFPFTYGVQGMNRRHDRDPAKGWNWFGLKWDKVYCGEQVLATTLFRAYRAAGGDSAHFAEKKYASRYLFSLMLKAISSLQRHTGNEIIDDLDELVAVLGEADLNTIVCEGHPGGLWSKIFVWSFGVQGLYNPRPYPVQSEIYNRVREPADFVDIYIDDGRNGSYLPYLENATSSPGIWNRITPDGREEHQDPVLGRKNYAYVKIRNKGTMVASAITVSYFQALSERPIWWPDGWSLDNSVAAVSGSIAPGGIDYVIAGPFEWTPAGEESTLLFSVSTPDDKSNIEGDDGKLRVFKVNPLVHRIVALDNNIAMRKFTNIDLDNQL